MEEKDYLADISAIKNMMNKSSQFISLSGLSGVLAGMYALIGAFVASRILARFDIDERVYDVREFDSVVLESDLVVYLFVLAFAVVALSLATGIVLSTAKAKKAGERLWNSTSRRLVANFLVPLVTGGIFALLLIEKEQYLLVAPITLIFYGLACVNGSKYTFRDVRYLGLTIVLLGLAAVAYPQFSLLFWAVGFGVCHIIYGAIMYFKYDRK